MRCSNCKNHILQKSGNRIRLRIKGMIIFEDDICKAQCFWCGDKVSIPIQMQKGIPISSEKYYIKRKVDKIKK